MEIAEWIKIKEKELASAESKKAAAEARIIKLQICLSKPEFHHKKYLKQKGLNLKKKKVSEPEQRPAALPKKEEIEKVKTVTGWE